MENTISLNAQILDLSLKEPFGICIDTEGNLFIADSGNHRILKRDTSGKATLIAGGTQAGLKNGRLEEAQFNFPSSICVDKEGVLFVSDLKNHCVRKIETNGEVSTIAGSGKVGSWDAQGPDAKFNYPRGISLNKEGELYVSDSWNHRVRKVSKTGQVSTFAGAGPITDKEAGEENNSSFKDGSGFSVRLGTICGLTFDETNHLLVTDASNHRIRKISPDGKVGTIAGNGIQGFTTGPAFDSRLNTPTDIVYNQKGTFYFSDTYNDSVRMVNEAEDLFTLDIRIKDTDEKLYLNYPRGLAIDHKEEILYVLDSINNRLLKIFLKE